MVKMEVSEKFNREMDDVNAKYWDNEIIQQNRAYFKASQHPLAEAWIQANTKQKFLLLDDQLAKDELSKRIGLNQSLPNECKICKITKLETDHGVKCGYVQGGNRLAGNIVERAVGYALQRLEDVVERILKLDMQL